MSGPNALNFTAPVQVAQCVPATLSWTGGTPPYRFAADVNDSIVPFLGPEAINQTSYTVIFPRPAGSFVQLTLFSDGSSPIQEVSVNFTISEGSGDSSCLATNNTLAISNTSANVVTYSDPDAPKVISFDLWAENINPGLQLSSCSLVEADIRTNLTSPLSLVLIPTNNDSFPSVAWDFFKPGNITFPVPYPAGVQFVVDVQSELLGSTRFGADSANITTLPGNTSCILFNGTSPTSTSSPSSAPGSSASSIAPSSSSPASTMPSSSNSITKQALRRMIISVTLIVVLVALMPY